GRRRAASHAYVARSDTCTAAAHASGTGARSRNRVPTRLLRRFARTSVRTGGGTGSGRGSDLRRPEGDAHHVRASLLRKYEDSFPAELLSVHRAFGRDGCGVPAVFRQRLRELQAERLDGDPRLRHGASEGVDGCWRGRRAIYRLGLRDGSRPDRDASLRNTGHPHPVRVRHALPGAGESMNASYEWLRAFVATDRSAVDLAELLTMRCATVE